MALPKLEFAKAGVCAVGGSSGRISVVETVHIHAIMRRWVLRTALYALRSSFLPGANWDEYASREDRGVTRAIGQIRETGMGFPFLQIRATATIGRYLHGVAGMIAPIELVYSAAVPKLAA